MLDLLEATLTADSFATFRPHVFDPDAGLSVEEVGQIAEHVLGVLAPGFPWWAVERLVALAATEYVRFSGDLARQGGRQPLKLPFEEFLHVVYAWFVRDGSKESIEKFDDWLFAAPKGVAPADKRLEPGWSKQEQASSFIAQLGARSSR